VEKVGNSLKEDLAKLGYKSKHESTKRSGWLDWLKVTGTHEGLHSGFRPWAPTSYYLFVLFFCIDGCYSLCFGEVLPHQYHLAIDKLVVPCVAICLFLQSTHHHHLLPFGVVIGITFIVPR
jgi:hypothetical protein